MAGNLYDGSHWLEPVFGQAAKVVLVFLCNLLYIDADALFGT